MADVKGAGYSTFLPFSVRVHVRSMVSIFRVSLFHFTRVGE